MFKLLSSTSYEEKKSRFLAFSYEIENEEDNDAIMKQLREEHPLAKHLVHVARYPNRFNALVIQSSDDKEPVSSMKKASRFFERDSVSDLGIYIVRYYGGKELGASHLDHIYFTLAMRLYEEYKKKKNSK